MMNGAAICSHNRVTSESAPLQPRTFKDDGILIVVVGDRKKIESEIKELNLGEVANRTVGK